jgi:hypothetical protein
MIILIPLFGHLGHKGTRNKGVNPFIEEEADDESDPAVGIRDTTGK